MSSGDRDAGHPLAVRVGLAVVLAVVLGVILLVRPDGDEPPGGDGAATPSPRVVRPSATPTVLPSEETFCLAYRRLAATRDEYDIAPDGRGFELLRDSADRVLALGVPRTMSTRAVGGLHLALSQVYETLALTLATDAIPGGAEASELDGASAAFDAYLSDYCPGW